MLLPSHDAADGVDWGQTNFGGTAPVLVGNIQSGRRKSRGFKAPAFVENIQTDGIKVPAFVANIQTGGSKSNCLGRKHTYRCKQKHLSLLEIYICWEHTLKQTPVIVENQTTYCHCGQTYRQVHAVSNCTC